ncbi:hypothetical protein MKX01_019381 [Papaver californicum]|nr:hypothetical protein MKX01_019381 [Papaver californicum]
MTTVPGSLIWEIMKRNNVFLVKEFGNGNQMVQFSKEPNNLYNTVSVQSGKDSGVVLATTKTNKQKNPLSLVHKTVVVNFYRRDLKSAALARLNVVHRNLKVAKSGVLRRGTGRLPRNLTSSTNQV